MNGVLAAGYIALAAAVVLPLLHTRLALAVSAAGCVLLAVAGVATAGAWTHANLDLGTWLGFGRSALVCDGLAGIFFALVGATGAAVSLALLERPPDRVGAGLHSLLLLAVATVLGADQAFLFLLAWETITLSLYLLASDGRDRPGALGAAFLGGGLSKLGGAAILAAFALLYGKTGSFSFGVWAHAAPGLGDARSLAFVLLLFGLGSKIGILPLQGGLPPLYEAAPGATAATMAAAFAAGLYGLWRLVYGTLGPGPLWWGEVVIVIGGLTALVGILYAVAKDEIPRVLAFSSVENGGIILLGFGVALVGQAAAQPDLAAAGLLAATLQLIMHGLAKVLAFLAAARVEDATGERRLLPLGGLGAPLPRTAAALGIAVLSLAAMPPFGGFVSEWFTFEALLQSFRLSNTVAELVMALGAAMLALTAGIGFLAFARLLGGIFLGAPRRRRGDVREPAGAALGAAALTVGLIALGPVAPWEIRWLGHGLSGLLGFDLAGTTIKFPLVLGPVYRGFSVLSPTWLAVGIPTFVVAAALLVRVVLRPTVRRAPVWVSGTAPDIATVQYTPEGYANPIRVVLAGLYGFRRSASGARPRVVTTTVVPAFEAYLYRPVTLGGLWLSAQFRRLQSGRLSLYLLYILAVLIAVLALIPALKD